MASQQTLEQPVGEPDEPLAGSSRPRPPRLAVVPLIVALVFFFTPAVASLLGDRAEPIDNRPLATMPALSDGWNLIPAFTLWANDHLPLRSEAVSFGTVLSEEVFGEPPQYGVSGPNGPASVGVGGGQPAGDDDAATKAATYPQVIPGTDDWLYFGGDVSSPCTPAMSVAKVVDGLTRLTEAVQSSGRRIVIGIAPDKSTVVPQHLPATYAGKDCATERKEAFWSALGAAPDVAYVDPRQALEQASDAGEMVYRPQDSHWSPEGAAVFVQQLVSAIDPGLLDPSTSFVDVGDYAFPGDLAAMLGTPTTDPMPDVRVDRPGVTTSLNGVPIPIEEVPEATSSPSTVTNSSTEAPLLPGHTLVLGDSFYQGARYLLTPFFADVTAVHNEVADTYPETVADLVVDADTVVVELVERGLSGGNVALVEPHVLSTIEKALAKHPKQ